MKEEKHAIALLLGVGVIFIIVGIFFVKPPIGQATSYAFCDDGSQTGKCATHTGMMCMNGRYVAAPGCEQGRVMPSDGSCADGTFNMQETDVDCGGAFCPRCATGKKCERNTDCASQNCYRARCV